MTENQQLNNPSGPSTATIKRLFAESGNRCTFPKCTSPIVEGKTVVGKICHIKAREKGGPRFDANQTSADRHDYDNLILLCGKHHDVIDDDPDAYTVERLHKMKLKDMAGVVVLSEEQVEQGAQLLLDQSISTTYQSGGITAHTVNIHFDGSTTHDPAEMTKARTNHPTPNLLFTGADIAPVSGAGQTLWSRDMGRFEKQWVVEHGQVALLAKFTNEAQRASSCKRPADLPKPRRRVSADRRVLVGNSNRRYRVSRRRDTRVDNCRDARWAGAYRGETAFPSRVQHGEH
jgi:hypothetical protein